MSIDESGMISREARVHAGGGQYEGSSSNSYVVHIGVAGQNAVSQAERLLAGIPGGVDKAVRSAISRAASHLRTISARTIRERYAISQANIRANENVQISYSYQDGVQAHVIFSGERIPLYRFDGAAPAQPTKDTSRRFPVMHGTLANGEGKWHLMYPGIPAHGHVLKSTSPALFQHAFVARMKTGHVGIYERTGGMTSGDKDEIEELFGPAVPQMLGSQEVAEKLAAEAMRTFEDRLIQNVNAILYGYMEAAA